LKLYLVCSNIYKEYIVGTNILNNMLKYQDKDKSYIFIVRSKLIDDIKLKESILKNDAFSKYNAIANIEGELIICSNLEKIDTFSNKVITETYDEYLSFIKQRDFQKEQWVYNILDGKAEKEKIIYINDNIVIIPCYTWDDHNDLTKMHILVFPKDRTLHSIRDLDASHIELLEFIKSKTLEIIKTKYNFDSDIIKMYLHYSPSTYHLHVHFVLIGNIDVRSSCEYSHELNNVIENLKICSDYYKLIKMNKLI